MTRRFLSVIAWLTVGHAVLGLQFWLLLQVPESNAAMLAVSLLLVVSMVAVAGWVEGVGLRRLSRDAGWRDAWRRAAAAPLAMVLGLLVFGVIWLATAHAAASWQAHRGEADAWLMLHFGWTRTAGLHVAVARVLDFIRLVVGTVLALTVLAWALEAGPRALARAGAWLRAAFALRRLLLVTLLFYGLVWLPWKAAYWRPAFLAPNWQEAAFASVKLGTLYLVANVGWAAILLLVQQGTERGDAGR